MTIPRMSRPPRRGADHPAGHDDTVALCREAASIRANLAEMAADRAAGLMTRAEQLADSERGNKRLAEIAAGLAKAVALSVLGPFAAAQSPRQCGTGVARQVNVSGNARYLSVAAPGKRQWARWPRRSGRPLRGALLPRRAAGGGRGILAELAGDVGVVAVAEAEFHVVGGVCPVRADVGVEQAGGLERGLGGGPAGLGTEAGVGGGLAAGQGGEQDAGLAVFEGGDAAGLVAQGAALRRGQDVEAGLTVQAQGGIRRTNPSLLLRSRGSPEPSAGSQPA
jgi:hypothetical protein